MRNLLRPVSTCHRAANGLSKNSAQINAQFFGLAALSPDNGSEKLQRGRLMPQALFRPWQQGLALPRPFIGDLHSQRLKRQARGMPCVEYRLDEIGRKLRQPKHTREVSMC